MPILPRLLITLGDVAGVGPEIAVRAWSDPRLHAICTPIIIGDIHHARLAAEAFRFQGEIYCVDEVRSAQPRPDRLPCVQGTNIDMRDVRSGHVSSAGGQAAFDFLCTAIDLVQRGEADGIVTLPLNKEGLHAAGLPYPGHTEILADRCGVKRYAMALMVRGGETLLLPRSHMLAVTHATLHVPLRDVFALLHSELILEKIELTATMLEQLLNRKPRIGVCGLNPHASDGGLFGDEEARLIRPAAEAARERGHDASGPWPSDTLYTRAVAGEFDGVIAMYHDQGHIAIKLLAGYRAVNVTLGLPLVRTSVAHGTAYDIAGRGVAECTGLIEAATVAARLASARMPG
jgi:4-hydroxythreonine-4-phosphate dehydrogenase